MEEHLDVTEGKYYRWSEKISNYFFIEIAFLLSIVPAGIGMFFLISTINNILLYALFFSLMGPGLGALIAMVEALQSSEVSAPFFTYWKKWYKNLKDSFLLTTLFSIILVVCIVDYTYFKGTQLDFAPWFFILLLLLATIIYEYSMVIAMKFSFRLRDILRLSITYLLTDLVTTLKLISYTMLLVIFSLYISTATTPLFIILFAYVLVKDTRLIIREIEDKYTQNSVTN